MPGPDSKHPWPSETRRTSSRPTQKALKQRETKYSFVADVIPYQFADRKSVETVVQTNVLKQTLLAINEILWI